MREANAWKKDVTWIVGDAGEKNPAGATAPQGAMKRRVEGGLEAREILPRTVKDANRAHGRYECAARQHPANPHSFLRTERKKNEIDVYLPELLTFLKHMYNVGLIIRW